MGNNFLLENEVVENVKNSDNWKGYEKFTFRVVFAFVIQLCVPFNPTFYTRLSKLDWATLNWQSLGGIASSFGAPNYVEINDIWGVESYSNVFLSFVVGIVVAGIWSVVDKKTTNYRKLYYWILVLARYRVAYGIIAWGYKKLIPMQMELPTRTFMETPFLDFSEQKLYWQFVGIAQNYEMFLGFTEIAGGILLLFRKTTSLGAALIAVILANVVISNHAYDGMVHVPSFVYSILGAIILYRYLPNIYKLIVKQQDVAQVSFYPVFKHQWQVYTRQILRVSAFSVFVVFLFYLQASDPVGYRFPHDSPGLKGAAGVYEVTEFKLNNQVVPYSPLDSIRWHDAVFEDWSTFTFKVDRAQDMDIDNTGREGKESMSKRFEFRGIGGGRVYYDYKIDSTNHILYMTNKNKSYRNQKQVLHYDRPTESRIVLSGTNEFKDSIFVVLDRTDKKYLLDQTREKEFYKHF